MAEVLSTPMRRGFSRNTTPSRIRCHKCRGCGNKIPCIKYAETIIDKDVCNCIVIPKMYKKKVIENYYCGYDCLLKKFGKGRLSPSRSVSYSTTTHL